MERRTAEAEKETPAPRSKRSLTRAQRVMFEFQATGISSIFNIYDVLILPGPRAPLQRCLAKMCQGLLNLTSWVILIVVTVLRQDGMRFVIYVADHEPAHVHVFGDGEARIDIGDLRLISQGRMSDRDVRRAVLIVKNNLQFFIDTWSKHHG